MKVDFIEFSPVTDVLIYGTIKRTYSDGIITVVGITSAKWDDGTITALIHVPAPEDDDSAYPCELLEAKCHLISNMKLSRYLQAHSFSIKSLLIYYGMREE